jgi:hypothetical protein
MFHGKFSGDNILRFRAQYRASCVVWLPRDSLETAAGVRNPARPFLTNLDSLPSVDYDMSVANALLLIDGGYALDGSALEQRSGVPWKRRLD